MAIPVFQHDCVGLFKSNKMRFIRLSLSFLVSFFGYFSDVFAANDAGCPSLSGPNDIIQCALKNHPDILRAESALMQGEVLGDVARQRPNPELGTRILTGKASGEPNDTAEVNLSHVFELGGKRDARIQRAQAERDIISTGMVRAKEEVYLSTLLSLHRLRQAQGELHLLDEALSTFNRIRKIYKTRPSLNPEQKVSVGVFQLAAGESELRKSALESEIKTLIRSLEIATKGAFKLSDSILPQAKISWPVLTKRAASVSGALIIEARSQLNLARSESNLAESQAWPDLRLGPSAQFQRQSGTTETQIGVNLTMPLPIYQTNKAGKAYAQQGITRAEQNLRLIENGVNLQREALIEKYDASVAALKKAGELSNTEKNHRSVEDLFSRGLVPSALVIESHRQIIEFTKSHNEQELTALEALVRVYAIEGRLFEEKL